MRPLIAFFVIVLILLQTFSKLGVYISFKINQTYIANTLCINKAKPQLHCNGKCYLSKKLRQAATEDQTPQAAGLKLPELLLCCQPFDVYRFSRVVSLLYQQHPPSYEPVPVSYFLKDVFHPPQV